MSQRQTARSAAKVNNAPAGCLLACQALKAHMELAAKMGDLEMRLAAIQTKNGTRHAELRRDFGAVKRRLDATAEQLRNLCDRLNRATESQQPQVQNPQSYYFWHPPSQGYRRCR